MAFDGKIKFDENVGALLIAVTENLNKDISYRLGRLGGGIIDGWLGEQKGWQFEQNRLAANNIAYYIKRQPNQTVTPDFFTGLSNDPQVVKFKKTIDFQN